MKKKLCLGSAEPPIHSQHLQVMKDYENWQLVDLYIDHPDVLKMDATTLDGVPGDYLEHIYASHLLEHLSHRQLPKILKVWHDKLKNEGKLTINVPDLEWASRQVIKFVNGQMLDSEVYGEFEGNNGLQSIFYGTHDHEGEYHKSGFTSRSLESLLKDAGFKDVKVEKWYEAHDMGCLLAIAKK